MKINLIHSIWSIPEQIKRSFSSTKIMYKPVTPVVTYNNIEDEKSLILLSNKGKSGIYRWTNIINNKSYIGSANDLRTRFYVYFSPNRLKNSKMIIYKAILKYGYESFKLDILEYCEKDIILGREQSYIDLLKPEYNNLTFAASSLGYKHTDETLKKFSVRKISDETRTNLAKAAKNRILSEEVKAKISLAKKGTKLSAETFPRAKLSAIGALREGVAVEVTNIKKGKTQYYSTLTSAGKALGVSKTSITKAMLKGTLIKKTYSIKSIPNE